MTEAFGTNDTITFDATVFTGGSASLIRLQSGQLTISEAVHIDGGSLEVVISGDANGDDSLVPGTFITDIAASHTAGVLGDNNGRILEVVTPAADFDIDGDVDGADFLAWQRGFGTQAPNATKADGDANNDTAVDSSDLAIWQIQFGQVVSPIVATVTTSSTIAAAQAADLPTTEPTVTSVLSAALIDAAIALDSVGDVRSEAAALLVEPLVFRLAAIEPVAPRLFAPTTRSDFFENTVVDREEAKETEAENQWLSDELLVRVFG